MEKEKIQEMKEKLERNDISNIAERADLRIETVSRFFNFVPVSEDTELKVMVAFYDIVEDRLKNKRSIQNKIDKLLQQ
jgi:hypothetical protein